MDTQVIIVGAGISGLSTALTLQDAGIEYRIVEAENEVGGRVRTRKIDGYLLDRGFQVLLSAYPEAQHFLDYDALDLQSFDSGAKILSENGKTSVIGDPMRQISSLIPTVFSSVGTIGDKMKMLKLKGLTKMSTIEKIFAWQETSTLQRLKEFGFSDKIIEQFFRPFFSGIFLENELTTSSRMFHFVFKMFAEGFATLPQGGMQQIPVQLANKLDSDKILLNHRAFSLSAKEIIFENGKKLSAEHVILATDPSKLLDAKYNINRKFVSTTHVHFVSDSPVDKSKLISLNSLANKSFNNICIVSNIASGYAKSGHLISISIVGLTEEKTLEDRLRKELINWYPSVREWRLLDIHQVNYALPDQKEVRLDASINKAGEIWLAGDYLSNGSLNGAMRGGRQIGKKIIESYNS
ncbi:FAD-dependent oxidoreductase [Saprospiraceae bacterium]|nr:FAD-dependent oxidoreductase [Saprospiraceae bacterium]